MNFKGHLLAGLLTGVLLSIFFLNMKVSSLHIVLGFFGFVISSIIPDIDHHKSIPRKGFRLVLITLLSITASYTSYQLFGKTRKMFFFAIISPIIGYYFIEKNIPKHRGILHTYQFVFIYLIMIGRLLKLFRLKKKLIAILLIFISLGYILHLVLDKVKLRT